MATVPFHSQKMTHLECNEESVAFCLALFKERGSQCQDGHDKRGAIVTAANTQLLQNFGLCGRQKCLWKFLKIYMYGHVHSKSKQQDIRIEKVYYLSGIQTLMKANLQLGD